MNVFFERLVSAYRVLFVKKIIIIETWAVVDKEFLSLFTTIDNELEQMAVLRECLKSMEHDHQQRQIKLSNLEAEKQKQCQ